MHAQDREECGRRLVSELGTLLRNAGHNHEEVVCVLLHALQLAEHLSQAVHNRALRPAGERSAPEVIAECRAELQRRAG